ncbi:MAG: hypothetical protein ACOYKE_02565 [Ferruginibacter sp.]
MKFDVIETDNRIYLLKNELILNISEINKKSLVIENKLLDIYAVGLNLAEAENDFFVQFDFTYRRLLCVADKKLSKHLLDAKKYINLLVDKVKDK